MNNNLQLENLNIIPCCDSCGAEYTNQHDLDELQYVRSTSSEDIYRCSLCNSDTIAIPKMILADRTVKGFKISKHKTFYYVVKSFTLYRYFEIKNYKSIEDLEKSILKFINKHS